MENSDDRLIGFPKELLNDSIQNRIDYFVNHTMAHPRLNGTYQSILDAIYKAPGTSLIFVVGPSGVGKTTLLHRLQQKILENALPELELDRGKIPIFGVEAKSPEFSQFQWKDFYIRLLQSINEPLIDKKIDYQDRSITKKESKDIWRLAVESALKNRRPDAFYIDEAHHLAQLSSGQKLKDQPEVLKSLANLGKVKIIPAGTYDLMQLIDLGDQLCRRSKIIHFSRYQAVIPEEQEIFKNIIKNLESELPLHEKSNLIDHWDFLYERSLGCVGILKDWLSATLYDVLTKKKPATTIRLKDLEHNAPTVKQCSTMVKAILAGEKQFRESKEELDELRINLGLKPLDLQVDIGVSSTQSTTSAEPASSTTQSTKQRQPIGQPKPQRLPIGDTIDAA